MEVLEQHTAAVAAAVSNAISLAFANNVKAGSLLIAGLRTNGAGTPQISDTLGDTWLSAVSVGTATHAIWYVKASLAGANTVTINGTGGAGYRLALQEWSGMDSTAPLDQVASSAPTATTSAVSGTTASVPAGEVAFAAITNAGAETYTGMAAGWVDDDHVSDATNGSIEASHIITTLGTQQQTWTLSASDAYSAEIATFKAAAVAAAAQQQLTMLGVGV